MTRSLRGPAVRATTVLAVGAAAPLLGATPASAHVTAQPGVAEQGGYTVAPLGPAGRYQVGYRVVSAEGHPVEGSTSFTLTRAGTGTPPAQPAAATSGAPETSDGGSPIWPWIVAAAVAVAAATFLALRLGRS